jgi:hypothetical protein
MNEKDILEQMKSIGLNAKNIMQAASTSEGVLSGLLAKKNEMPDGLFEKLDSSLNDVRAGKKQLKETLNGLSETLKKNGNNNNK